ncbi:hypothetical protein [Paenibacillus sp. VMFN-D1]|uniref:hypothetical protein n=1 Tax=Paenibacillus sp. VMFN-D1 TaxID=2135608 RepID=UPI000E2825C3|nr:hypothetical protein [Paenibacillus sp. VMFN-D1]RED32407.1 hypothetical protein C7820_5687 [Paenibacillus sp. VMFN-D1]
MKTLFMANSVFGSTRAFLDYDVLIIDPYLVFIEYCSHSGYQHEKIVLNKDVSNKAFRDLRRRRDEIEEFLSLGRTIFIFTPPPMRVRLLQSNGNIDYDLRKFIPVYPETSLTSGNNIEFMGSDIFKPFWDAFKDDLYYLASFKEPFGEPLFKIKNTNNFIGSIIRYKEGTIVFLPSLSVKSSMEMKLTQILNGIATKLKEEKAVSATALPEWSNHYFLPKELNLKKDILENENELNHIQQKIQRHKEDLKRLEEFKHLFTSTGTILEKIVGKVFELLGFEVAEGLPGRDDLILKYKDKIAVVEVKGVSKSAAEKHAAQLEKWVSEYLGTKNIAPKGILIVNAYKDTPILERTESAFPDQMLDYCRKRNHCLITGLDLLSIYLYIQENPQKKEDLINELFDTCGVFNKLSWQDFLHQNNPVLLN